MMTPSRSRWAFRLASLLFAAAPVAFSLIAGLGMRHDLRWAWMALASLIGATVVMAVGRPRGRAPGGVVGVGLLALAVAMACAAWAGFHLGATAVAGVLPVAFVLSVCWAASYALDALAHPRTG